MPSKQITMDMVSITAAEGNRGFRVTFETNRPGQHDFQIPVLVTWGEHLGPYGSIKDVVPRAMAILHRDLSELAEATKSWAGPVAPKE